MGKLKFESHAEGALYKLRDDGAGISAELIRAELISAELIRAELERLRAENKGPLKIPITKPFKMPTIKPPKEKSWMLDQVEQGAGSYSYAGPYSCAGPGRVEGINIEHFDGGDHDGRVRVYQAFPGFAVRVVRPPTPDPFKKKGIREKETTTLLVRLGKNKVAHFCIVGDYSDEVIEIMKDGLGAVWKFLEEMRARLRQSPWSSEGADEVREMLDVTPPDKRPGK